MKIKEIVTEAGVLSGLAQGLAPDAYSAYQKARDTGNTMRGPASLDKKGNMIINDPKLAAQYEKERQLVNTMQQRAVMQHGISVDEIDRLVTQSGKYPDAKQRQDAVDRFVGLLQQQNVNVIDRTLGGTSGGMTKQQFMRPSPSAAAAPAAAAQTAPAASAANAGASMTAKMSAASTPQSTAQALRQRRAQGLPESKAQKKIIRHK
jgi:hypothetical protein